MRNDDYIMRTTHRLVAKSLTALPAGKHLDGDGLLFIRRPGGGAQWVLRIAIYGRRREMGLGSFPQVSLSEARRLAESARADVRAGGDPIRARQKARREARRSLHLVRDIARDAFEVRKAELKGDDNAGRWFSPIQHHVLPKLGAIPVSQLNQIDIRDALAPIWHSKADTGRKALTRLAICLRHAAALGIDVDLQVTDKARALLGKSLHKAEHIPAMPWTEVPAFYDSLTDGSISHLALRLLILSGVRSRPLRFIRADQIDGDTWIIPAEGMKGRKGATSDFRVPLSAPALAIVRYCSERARDGYLFPARRTGVISDMTMAMHMKRAGLDYRPHGFRSSLRDWVAETTNTPFEVAETVLGHTVGGSVERSYRRTDYIDARRILMERWADHVTGTTRNSALAEEPPTTAEAA